MREPLSLRSEREEDRALHKALEAAYSDELAALAEAAALIKARAPQQEIWSAHQRCETARTRKVELVRKLHSGAGG